MLTIVDIEITTFHIDKSWTSTVNSDATNLIVQPELLIVKSKSEDFIVIHIDVKVKVNIDNPNSTFIHLFTTIKYEYPNIHQISDEQHLEDIYDNIVELSYATIRGIIYEKAYPVLGKFIIMIPEKKLRYIVKDIDEIELLVNKIPTKPTVDGMRND